MSQSDADQLSFLAPPGQVADWRMLLLYEVAAGAGVLDDLARAPSGSAALADRLGLDQRAVRVLLEALSVWGVLVCSDDGLFAPGPGWPRPGESASLRHHARAVRSWSASLDDRLRGIVPVEPRRLPPDVGLWLEALAFRARECAPAVVDACLTRSPHARRALELGGGHGEYGLELARRGLEVTMQDRPEVVDLVRAPLERAGMGVFAGDFFEIMPDGPFDLVLCAGINHTYDGEHNAALCRRAAEVLAPGGTLAIVTYLRGRDDLAPVFAVQMLAGGAGGDTHGEADFRRWLGDAGVGGVDVVSGAHPRESLLLASR